MTKKLIVRDHFGDFVKGQEITDPEAVSEILGGPFAHCVIPVDVVAPADEDAQPA